MATLIGTLMMAATLSAATGAAMAQQVSEQRGVDARIQKVKLDGVISVRIKQGPTAQLLIIGDKRDVAKVVVTQSGDTLAIGTEHQGWHFGAGKLHEVRAELTLPNLSELASHGLGATDVQGFSGNAVTLTLDGAGAVTLSSNYKNVVAHLGGVGSMTLNAGDTEQVDLQLRGAGQISVNGHSRLLRASLGGVGSLEAKGLQADAVELDMSGLGGATVFAKQSAKLTLSGLGSATVYGKPGNRSADASGLGSVSWR